MTDWKQYAVVPVFNPEDKEKLERYLSEKLNREIVLDHTHGYRTEGEDFCRKLYKIKKDGTDIIVTNVTGARWFPGKKTHSIEEFIRWAEEKDPQ